MVKLGESRLGSVQFSEAGDIDISDEVSEAVRERAENVIKSIYPTEEGTNWDKILKVVLDEHKREHEVIRDIISGRFIDDADGEQLDMLGEQWNVYRRSGEGDDHFRTRIKLQLPRHTSRATVEEIKNVSEVLLDTDSKRITVDENFYPYDGDPETEVWEQARFDLYIEEIVFHDAGVTVEEFETLIQDVKPAGVRAFATIGDQFTHRSVSDFNGGRNDPSKAYGGYDAATVDGYDPSAPTNDAPATLDDTAERLDVGGPYADEISEQYT